MCNFQQKELLIKLFSCILKTHGIYHEYVLEDEAMEKVSLKLNYKKTFILGFGFFTTGLVWPLYNVYVPLFLRDW